MLFKKKTNVFNVIKDCFFLLSKKRKYQYCLILFLFLIAAFVETLGIGLIFALLNLIISGSIVETKYFEYFSFLKFIEIDSLLLIILLLYFFKSVFLSLFYWVQNKYVLAVENDISRDLFNVYVKLPINFHLNTNTSTIIRNITVETGQFSGSILMNSLVFFKNIFLFLFLFCFLALMNFKITIISTMCFFIFGFIYQKIMSDRSYSWGERRQFYAGQRFKKLQEAFKGIKTIKIFNEEKFFFDKYFNTQIRLNSIRLKQTFFKNVPRIWFEFIAISGFVILLFYFLKVSINLTSILPALGTLVLVMLRLIPAIIQIINNFQHFDFSKASLAKIKEDLELIKNTESTHFYEKKFKSFENIIFKDVYYKYPEKDNYTLRKVNLEIKKGKSIGIYGSSGEGKSTLLNLISGLIYPSKGEILIDEKNILENVNQLRENISFIPQDIFMTDSSIIENIRFGYNVNDSEDLNKLIDQVSLNELIDSLENKERTIIGESGQRVSGGELQRISIARGLARKRQILLLDEPTKSLDRENSKKIVEVIRAIRKIRTVICVSHDFEVIKDFDEIYEISKGSLNKK